MTGPICGGDDTTTLLPVRLAVVIMMLCPLPRMPSQTAEAEQERAPRPASAPVEIDPVVNSSCRKQIENPLAPCDTVKSKLPKDTEVDVAALLRDCHRSSEAAGSQVHFSVA